MKRFLDDPDVYGTRYVTGRPPSLSARDQMHLFRRASLGEETSKQLLQYLETVVHDSTVRRYLRDSKLFKYIKRQKTPKLTQRHKSARILWAKEKIDYGSSWDDVIFSDEKKFNLDGPDGCKFYWHDLRKEKETFYSRQMGGGSLMIWAGFSAKGKTKIAFLKGKQDSGKYIQTLFTSLLPFIRENHCLVHEFQQDNAPIHTSTATKAFLNSANINTMQWPALSPDLNPIENVWGMLACRVYANGAQFNDLRSLEARIQSEWDKITLDELQPFISSMKNRCIAVIENKGANTKY